MIYNHDCLLVADIVKVFHHVQSGHPDKPLGTLTQAECVIGYWLTEWQGMMVTTIENSVSQTKL